MATPKKRWGDRFDATLVRDIDPLHWFMPYLYPNRADNEAVLNEVVDMTAVIDYIAKKNEGDPEFKYTFFHFIVAAVAKLIVLRPKLNRFYSGHRLYDRKEMIFSFIVKIKDTKVCHLKGGIYLSHGHVKHLFPVQHTEHKPYKHGDAHNAYHYDYDEKGYGIVLKNSLVNGILKI